MSDFNWVTDMFSEGGSTEVKKPAVDEESIDWEGIEDTEDVFVPETNITGGDMSVGDTNTPIDWESIANDEDTRASYLRKLSKGVQ